MGLFTELAKLTLDNRGDIHGPIEANRGYPRTELI